MLKVSDVAAVLNVSTWQVRHLVRGRGLPAYRVGDQLRIAPDDLKAWLESNQEGGTDA
nr:helix-turn-helix domain-containing protein [Isoptericola halotolerans]